MNIKDVFRVDFFSLATRGRRGHKGGNSNVVINKTRMRWCKHAIFSLYS
jgi:hypothetical protein